MGSPATVTTQSSTTKTSDQSFEQDVIKSAQPVLVDFWAEWCGPCKMIAPALEEMAGQLAGRLTVAKINIDENPQTPKKYGVRGIPTLMLFKDGQVAATKIGAAPKSKLLEWVESVL
ncbi:MAG TPA: thioredoxin TrxA [Dongiaceae bacterium]|nr:thioredoxin TrxA [Dongiaceae bacterium]